MHGLFLGYLISRKERQWSEQDWVALRPNCRAPQACIWGMELRTTAADGWQVWASRGLKRLSSHCCGSQIKTSFLSYFHQTCLRQECGWHCRYYLFFLEGSCWGVLGFEVHSLEYELLCLLYFELQLDLMDFYFTDQPLKSHQGNVICRLDVCISSAFLFLLSAKV